MTTRPKGFAHMKKNNPDRLAEVARRGGASVPKDKRSFAVDRSLAMEAGRKGGLASRQVKAR